MALFADAGQYADSMARLRECCKQQGISIYYFSEDAVNAGVDTGYAKQDTISGDDKHFGWRLGRFFLTGFTRVTADENSSLFSSRRWAILLPCGLIWSRISTR